MSALIDFHYWITGFAYPATNALLVALSILGFLKTKYPYQFVLIGISAGLSVFISSIFLILKIQKEFDVSIVSKSAAMAIWPIQAIGEYVSMGLYMIGFFWLILSLTKAEDKK